jgi:hypothetical protein
LANRDGAMPSPNRSRATVGELPIASSTDLQVGKSPPGNSAPVRALAIVVIYQEIQYKQRRCSSLERSLARFPAARAPSGFALTQRHTKNNMTAGCRLHGAENPDTAPIFAGPRRYRCRQHITPAHRPVCGAHRSLAERRPTAAADQNQD